MYDVFIYLFTQLSIYVYAILPIFLSCVYLCLDVCNVEQNIYKRKQESNEKNIFCCCFFLGRERVFLFPLSFFLDHCLGRERVFFLFFLISFLVESVFTCFTFLFSFINSNLRIFFYNFGQNVLFKPYSLFSIVCIFFCINKKSVLKLLCFLI